MRDGIVIHTILASVVLLVASATAAGAAPLALSCHQRQQPKMVAELLFGRDVGHHAAVSQSAWLGFVARGMICVFLTA